MAKRECNCKKSSRIADAFSGKEETTGGFHVGEKLKEIFFKIISSIFIFVIILVVCPAFAVYSACCVLFGKDIRIELNRKHKKERENAEKLQDKD